jgi:hypothetical protein
VGKQREASLVEGVIWGVGWRISMINGNSRSLTKLTAAFCTFRSRTTASAVIVPTARGRRLTARVWMNASGSACPKSLLIVVGGIGISK